MTKRNLEELSTETLGKRKRFASLLLGILIGLVLVNVVVGVVTRNLSLAATAAALLAVGLPMFVGMKKINAELKKRDDAHGVSRLDHS